MGEKVWEYFSSYAAGVVFCVCLLTVIKSLHPSIKRLYQLPPGPKGWPIIGSLAHLSGDGRNDYLFGLVQNYGEIFSLRLGCQLVVVVNKYHDALKLLLLDGHVLSERAPIESLDRYFKGRGIAGAKYSADWKDVRRFIHNIFRSLGVGRRRFEDNVLAELDYMMLELEQRAGNKEKFDPVSIFNTTTANVIGSVIFGQRFDRNDEIFQTMKDALHRSLRLVQYGGASTFLPFMRYLPTLPGLKAFYREMDTAIQCQQIFINKYKHQQRNQDQQPTNIIDAYLNEVSLGDSDSPTFSEDSLAFVINDLFLASTETTASVLTWAILALILHPHIQEKVHQEIDSQVSTDRQITLADKHNLPYTQAVLLESLRYGCVVPAAMRATTQDTKILGYNIPAGTIVMLNYYYANFDPDVWQVPTEFKPQRFLDEEGQLVHRNELIPFSIGRRNCLGDNLAKMEIFLVFSNLLKSYHFEPTEGAKLSLKAQPGVTRVPFPYTVRATNRSNSM